MDLSKYRQLYVSETQENLDNLGRLLVELEASPGHRAHTDTVFRLLHSIKGMSGTMGYPPIFQLAHHLEDLLAQVRAGRAALDAAAIDALLAGVDRMGQWVAEVEADRPLSSAPADAALLARVGQLTQAAQRAPGPAAGAQASAGAAPRLAASPTPAAGHAAATTPTGPARSRAPAGLPGMQAPPILLTPINPGELQVEVVARAECPDPGARGFLLLRKLAPLGTVVDVAPPESELRAGRLVGPLRLSFVTPHAAEHIESYVRLMPDWQTVSVVDRDASQLTHPPPGFGDFDLDDWALGDGALDGGGVDGGGLDGGEPESPAHGLRAQGTPAPGTSAGALAQGTPAPGSPAPGTPAPITAPRGAGASPTALGDEALVAGDPELLGALDGLDFDFMDSAEQSGERMVSASERIADAARTPAPTAAPFAPFAPPPVTAAPSSASPSPTGPFPASPTPARPAPASILSAAPAGERAPSPSRPAVPPSTQPPRSATHAPPAPLPPRPGAQAERRSSSRDDEVEFATVPLPALVLVDASLEASLDTGLYANDSLEATDPASAAAMRARRAAARTIRVRTTWLDGLLDRINGLREVSQRLVALQPPTVRSPVGDAVGELGQLLDQLHADALSARMTSFAALAQRLPRVVRDLARQAGKRATILVRGGDELIDRAIIEGLDAPITHLLRNAIDHGIEDPAERAAAHKPVTGVLTLACVRVRDEIIVELSDDGRGIDRAAVAARAVELGLADPAAAAHDAEHDLGRLLALPGLTTRRTAGALAGRGVGLDAVQSEVAALGGTMVVTSRPGFGSVFRLHLPRTPGITRLLMLEADGQTFGVPQARVVRTATFDAAAVETAEGGGQTVHVDEPHRLFSLRALLGLPPRPLPARFPGVVLRDPRGPLVVAVDHIEGQQEAVIKPLGPLLERFEGLTGVTVSATGRPVFVLDLTRFIGPA